jgi:hypothetical protein
LPTLFFFWHLYTNCCLPMSFTSSSSSPFILKWTIKHVEMDIPCTVVDAYTVVCVEVKRLYSCKNCMPHQLWIIIKYLSPLLQIPYTKRFSQYAIFSVLPNSYILNS